MTLRRAFAQIVGVSTDFGGDCRNRKKKCRFSARPVEPRISVGGSNGQLGGASEIAANGKVCGRGGYGELEERGNEEGGG
jgi:hypothetical protein